MARKPTKADLEARIVELEAALAAESHLVDELRAKPVREALEQSIIEPRKLKTRKMSREELRRREDRARKMRNMLGAHSVTYRCKCGREVFDSRPCRECRSEEG